MAKKKVIEENILIARRVPPGDKWRLVANEPDGAVHKTLTDALEAYMVKTGFKGEYRLAPLKSELYAICVPIYEEFRHLPKNSNILLLHFVNIPNIEINILIAPFFVV